MAGNPTEFQLTKGAYWVSRDFVQSLGPRSFGIVGHHLDRKGAGGFSSLIEFTGAITQDSR